MIDMKVSVVIPVYNEEKRIKKCLDSLINQDEKPDEIIVVDNNCSDRTIEIVKKYKEVIIVKENTQGILFARNAGFDRAKGDIIARSDADTILPSHWIKSIKLSFSKDENIVAVSNPVFIHDYGFNKKFFFIYYIYLFIPRILMGHYSLVGPSMSIKNSAWKKIRKELCTDQAQVHEDVDVSLHVRKLGKVYHDKNNLVLTSGRRIIGNPKSFFGEYILRFFRMIWSHRHLL